MMHAIFADKWYCCHPCACKAAQTGRDDGVLNYAKTVVWQGLNHLARRQVIRDGNGPGMMEMWRLDLIDFWQHNHTKYFILAHNLLVGKQLN